MGWRVMQQADLVEWVCREAARMALGRVRSVVDGRLGDEVNPLGGAVPFLPPFLAHPSQAIGPKVRPFTIIIPFVPSSNRSVRFRCASDTGDGQGGDVDLLPGEFWRTPRATRDPNRRLTLAL